MTTLIYIFCITFNNMMETHSVESKIGELTNYSIRPLVKLSVDDLVFVGTLCKYRPYEVSVF